jgi:hypothetical protein
MSDKDVGKAQKDAQKFAARPKTDGEIIRYARIGEAEQLSEVSKFGKKQVAFPVEYKDSEGVKQLTFTLGSRTVTQILAIPVGKSFDLERIGIGEKTQWRVRAV